MAARLTELIARARRRRLPPPDEVPAAGAGARPQVLLECPADASPSIVASILEREGFDVVTCEGPTPGHHCRLTEGEPCTAVQDADVVFSMLDRRRPESEGVLPAMLASSERCPPVVVIGGWADEPPVPPGVRALSHLATGTDAVVALRHAIEEGPIVPPS